MYRTGKNGFEDIYVIGCGPSLKDFNWSLLKDKTTIAVNGALLDVPEPDYLVTADSRFVRIAAQNEFWNVTTYKVVVMGRDHRCFQGVSKYIDLWDYRIEPNRFDGNVSFNEDEFCTGQNSGFCGMQLAVILGAKRVHLLGMDFHTVGGEHYHTLYDSDPDKLGEFLVHFRTAIRILSDHDVTVISHSPTSRLNDILPYKEL